MHIQKNDKKDRNSWQSIYWVDSLNSSSQMRFNLWVKKNCVDPEQLSKIDLLADVGDDLSFQEALDVAMSEFPTLWKSARVPLASDRPKQIVFVKDLIEKIVAGNVRVTYRRAPKIGTYYIISNRFKQDSNALKLLIDCYQTDKVNPNELTDEEAQLAGVETAEKIRELFHKWYGSPIPSLYRNWFKIKKME